VVDQGQVLEATRAAGVRVADVIEEIAEPNAPTRGLTWTLGETAAHLLATIRLHRDWLRGDGAIDYGIPDLAARNQRKLGKVREKDPSDIARATRDELDAFVREASSQPSDARFAAEVGPSLAVAEMGGVLLGEILVHGYDVARTLGRPWPIARAEANLVAEGMLTILPQFVSPSAAAGASVAYEVRLRGGPTAVVRIRDGVLTVDSPPSADTAVDCHISADPAAFLLVGYGRESQWGPILRGRLVAWGRRPWEGLRFASYIRNP
jgi:uncharacterized protein (TIGR03083 family)